jgi:hypothetical protein
MSELRHVIPEVCANCEHIRQYEMVTAKALFYCDVIYRGKARSIFYEQDIQYSVCPKFSAKLIGVLKFIKS